MVLSCVIDTLVSRNGIEGVSPVCSRLNLMVWWNSFSERWNCFRLSSPCSQIPKTSSIYLTQRAGDWLVVARNLLFRSYINSMAKGGASLEPPQCPNKGRCIACQAGLEGRCTTKNVIYRLDCAICAESYIGETKRPVRERLLEHRRAALNRNEQNPWGAHYGTAHKGSPVPTIPFTARIIRRAQDHVDRKLGEAIEIAETTPLLNTDSGWQLLPTIRKRSST